MASAWVWDRARAGRKRQIRRGIAPYPGSTGLHGQHVFAQYLEAALVVRAVIFHLLGIPASANAKDEATSGGSIKTGDGLSCDNWIALRHERDPSSETRVRVARQRMLAQRRVVRVRVALGQLAAAWERGAPADRNVGVFTHEQRIKLARFELASKLVRQVGGCAARVPESVPSHSPINRLVATHPGEADRTRRSQARWSAF